MGDRYMLDITCPNCGHDDSTWYAPTCGVVDWTCPECGYVVDLGQYTGVSYEEASNRGTVTELCSSAEEAQAGTDELWPTAVMGEIEKVMREGRQAGKRGRGWGEPVEHHIGRAVGHLERYGHDIEEDHLAHAFTRLMMAVAIERGYVGGRREE